MKKVFVLLSLGLLVIPMMVFAAEFKSDETAVTVGEDKNPTNLYSASQTVTIDANVNKDVVAAGNSVNINGNVEESVLAAASSVNIKGNVGSNIRVASGNVLIQGNIGGDITSIGSSLTLEKNTINGDVIFAGDVAELNGTVNGSVYFAGNKLVINGPVKGTINTAAKAIEIGSNGSVEGNLNYWSEKELSFNEERIQGTVNYHERAPINFDLKGFWFFGLLAKSLGLLIALLLIVWLMPRFAKNFTSETYRNTWKNLGVGAISFFIIPIVCIMLLITLIGIPLAFVLGLVYILLLVASGVLTPLVIGSLAWKQINRADKYEADWKVALIGIVITFIINLIPVLGALITFVFMLFSLGEVSMTLWGVFRKQKA